MNITFHKKLLPASGENSICGFVNFCQGARPGAGRFYNHIPILYGAESNSQAVLVDEISPICKLFGIL
ncbi:MAG: hypothetical protein RSF77_06055, partial [Oscillospiraceae bacterium]